MSLNGISSPKPLKYTYINHLIYIYRLRSFFLIQGETDTYNINTNVVQNTFIVTMHIP